MKLLGIGLLVLCIRITQVYSNDLCVVTLRNGAFVRSKSCQQSPNPGDHPALQRLRKSVNDDKTAKFETTGQTPVKTTTGNPLFSSYIRQYLDGETNVTDTIHSILNVIKTEVLSHKMTPVQGGLEITEFLRTTDLTVNNITALASGYETNHQYTHALYLLYSAAKQRKLSDGDAVIHLQQRPRNFYNLVSKMEKDNQTLHIVMFLVLPLLDGLLQDSREIEGVPIAVKVESQAWIKLYEAFFLYHNLENYSQSAIVNEACISLVEQEFGENSTNYRVLGYCLNNAGLNYELMEIYDQALSNYERASEVLNGALDWLTEEEKIRTTEIAENNVKRISTVVNPDK